MDSHDHISVIEALACLGDLPLNHLSALIKHLESIRIPARQPLFQQGDSSELVYFIGSGSLAKLEGEEGVFSGRLLRGEMAGWNSFFHQCPRDHTLVAENDCYLYALKRQDMDELVRQHPELLAGFLMAATPVPLTGQSVTNAQVNKRIGVFTFDDLREEAGFAFERLMACYANNSRVTRCNSEDFCKLAGMNDTEPDLFGPLAADVFEHLENEYDTVFYAANAKDSTAWLQRITRQVDTLILLVRDTTDTLPEWFCALLKRGGNEIGLVILRTEPGDFDQRVLTLWDLFEPAWHYRLHLNDTRLWGSVGRMALGQAVNLVLSGGGCLGAMHCGILTALVRAGFPIDTISGTSAGGGIAIALALGYTPEVTAEKFRYAFTTSKPFKAYTLPYHGLINPKRFDRVLQEIAEGYRLEETRIPTHVIAANLTRSCAEVITTGPAWEAIRMTSSLPGILPAYIRNGCTYVDGGVVDNFPVSSTRQKYRGLYAGVVFDIPRDKQVNSLYEDRPGALKSTLNKLKIGKPGDFPGLGDVLIGSVTLGSTAGLKKAMNRVDMLLYPPVPPNIKVTSFERFDELYEIGIEYGENYISNLKTPFTINELAVFLEE